MRMWLVSIGLLLCGVGSSSLWAQGEEPAAAGEKERSIYVPYDELWKVFEKEGRGVFIPYEKFVELWDASRDQKNMPAEAKAPVDALITEVAAKASVSEDVVTVDAEVTIEVLKEGWNTVPLRLQDAAITKAVIGGKAARILQDPKQGYQLLLEKKGKEPSVVTLELSFAKSFTKSPGRNSVTFQAPLCPVSKWDVTIPESGVEVDIHPMLATTEVPAAGTNAVDQTHVLAFVGAASGVRIDWTPKAEGAKGLTALVSARIEQQMHVGEGVVRGQVRMDYTISRTELSTFEIEVPADQKVVNVFDQNVREWSVKQGEGVQSIEVQLFEPTKGAQSLMIELEEFTEALEVSVPVVKALNVGRQQGMVVIRIDPALRGEVGTREGLLQLDARELPASLKKTAPTYSYRYASLPYTLTVNLEKVQPRILADTLVEVHLTPDEQRLEATTAFTVERAGVFELELTIPDGYEVREVAGKAVGSVPAAAVDGHRLAEPTDGQRALTVNLSAKARGGVGLRILLVKTLNDVDLLSPTGNTVSLDAPLIRVTAERDTGRLMVFAPESLRVNPGESKGLRSVSSSEATAGFTPTMAPGERSVLSYRYGDEAGSLALDVTRRAPYVTCREFLTVRIENGVVKYNLRLMYEVLYSGVKSLRVDVPTTLVDDIRVTNTGIRYRGLANAENVPEGYAAWLLEGEAEFFGSNTITLTWETKVKTLDIGKSIDVSLPRLIPAELDRSWGQIVVAKAEGIDVLPAEGASGLRPIDPRMDLMKDVTFKDAAQAFEFIGPWKLSLKATRYETKDVTSTSVERGLVRSVVTRGDVTSVQAIYRMRSKQQRISLLLPEGVEFDSQPLRLNGRPVALEKGDGETYYVPLTNQQQDTPFVLELRYFVSGQGTQLQSPSFPEQAAVQQVYMSVYIPDEKVYVGKNGPWSEEMRWDEVRGFNVSPRVLKHDRGLITELCNGVEMDAASLENFATDGRHLLFSTLRPPDGKAGMLTVRTMHAWLLNTLVLAVIVLIGLTQLNASLGRRVMVVGLALCTVILLGVFFTSLVQAMVTNAAMAAGAIVLIIWFIWYLLVLRPKDPVVKARAEARLAKARSRVVPPVPVITTPEPEVVEDEAESKEVGETETSADSDKGGQDHDDA